MYHLPMSHLEGFLELLGLAWVLVLSFFFTWDGDPQTWEIHLVGGIPTPLKNMKVSWGYYSQYIWKKKCSKPPTIYIINIYISQKNNLWISTDSGLHVGMKATILT